MNIPTGVPRPLVRVRAWAGALALALATFGGWGCGRIGGVSEADIARRHADARKTGYPVSLAELDLWNRGLPSEEALAPVYEKALEARADVKWGEANYVAANQAAIAALLEATARGKARFPLGFAAGAEVKLPHLTKVRDGVRLLATNAVSRAEKGQMHEALESLRAGVRLARALEQEATVISLLVEAASVNILAQSAGWILGRDGASDADLVALDGELKAGEHGSSLERVLAGERCMGTWMFEEARRNPAQISKWFGAAPAGLDVAGLADGPRWRADLAYYLDCTMSNVVAAGQPFPGALAVNRGAVRMAKQARESGHMLSALLLSGGGATNGAFATGVTVRYGEMLARFRCLRLAVAVERSRLRSGGKLPGDVAPLVPEFLAARPMDPFDGQPLRYKRQRIVGYAVYSVGQDLSDDAGKARPRGRVVTEEFDVGVTVGR